jgi:hypothetical protein
MSDFVVTINEAELAAILADYYAASNDQRPNDFTPSNPSVVNTVNVAIAPAIPTAGNLQPTIDFATATAAASVANFGKQETPLVVTLLETLDDAGDLAGYLIQPVPKFWFGNIQVVMNGLTDAQRTTITNLDIGSQISVTKTFPNSTPSTVTQLMALEGISHDISPDRHIVTLYTNPARIYTYFIVGGYPVVATRTNLVANPNFETNATGWTAAAVTLTRITSAAYIGTACLQMSSPTAGDTTARTAYDPNTSIGAGVTLTASCYVYNFAGNNRGHKIDIRCFDSGGSVIQTFTGTAVTVNVGAGWTRLSVTGTTPANTASVDAVVFCQTTNTSLSNVTYVDAIMLEETASALPYFDGTYVDNYTGYGLNSKAWTGTANASTSVGTWYQGATRTNLIKNPSFETNVTGWSPNGSTNTRVAGTWSTGSFVYQIVHTATGLGGTFSDFASFNVVAGLQYTASFYAKSISGTLRGLQIAIVWYNSAGAQISASTANQVLTTSSQRWSVTATAPAGAVTGLVYAYTYTTGVIGDTWQMDSVLVEQTASALPYFDGTYADTYTGYTLTSQAWSGTADASTSTANWGLTSAFVGSQLNDETKGLG